jgi:hypothetical protein
MTAPTANFPTVPHSLPENAPRATAMLSACGRSIDFSPR